MRVHHIGYLVKKLERAQKAFEGLGFAVSQPIVRDELRKIDILFLEMDGYRVELVAPYDSTSVVAELRTRIGNSPYHICYEVDDLEAEVERLRNERYVVSSEPAPAPACGGKRVCFLIHPFQGMIELMET